MKYDETKENMNVANESPEYVVDVRHILKFLWKKAWIIAIAGILAGVIGFAIPTFTIEPTYSSSVMLYVNNSSISLGNTNFSISSSQISAAQSLVKTYGVILNNRTTLERIIQKTGVSYTYKELSGMITSSPSNGTEIMRVTVTSTDPYEAAEIANCIADVLPDRISEIIDGASMEVVDSAIPVLKKVGPSITGYTAVFMLLGVLLCIALLVVFSIIDDAIHEEDYLIQAYEYPILAKVPDLFGSENNKYSYSHSYGSASDSSNNVRSKSKKG